MHASLPHELRIGLPEWVPAWLAEHQAVGAGSTEARMRLVIGLAGENVARGTGGPFGAAVFERAGGRLVAVGVNVVVSAHCSAAHAEILALALAQLRIGSHSLEPPAPATRETRAGYQLVSSAEPCAMCLGAIAWSGACELVIGAREQDVREIGFDEGTKPDDWRGALAERGIQVVQDVLRAEACKPLARYACSGAPIYNGRARGGSTPRGTP